SMGRSHWSTACILWQRCHQDSIVAGGVPMETGCGPQASLRDADPVGRCAPALKRRPTISAPLRGGKAEQRSTVRATLRGGKAEQRSTVRATLRGGKAKQSSTVGATLRGGKAKQSSTVRA